MTNLILSFTLGLSEAKETLIRLLSGEARSFGRDANGSMALEYVLWVSGVGMASATAMSYLGIDIAELYQTVDLGLCRRLKTVCFK